MSEATIPEPTHQRAAVRETVPALGLPEPVALSADRPTPRPTMLRMTCATRAATAPARIAPQET
ncbi:hypothetical protein LDDCCGHA_4128 [Methylobacterium oxalidis]|nr:hypothetical protein LDDCCGHA_4128 [Methylobacterium oxalidis]